MLGSGVSAAPHAPPPGALRHGLARGALVKLLCAAAAALTCGLLSGCGQREEATALPTADIAPQAVVAEAAPAATATLAPSATPPPTQPPATETPAAPADPMMQYRLWMEEARAQYPYDEPIERMWTVMLCESSGDASQVSDLYYGLFQYLPDTWAGDWNPYRDQPILDARAQIFATAKAWHEGNQGWWGCY
jgi:hypothetical protein